MVDSSRKENNGQIKPKDHIPDYGRVILTLKNCVIAEEKLSPTPSALDGLDAEIETDLRILGCELIQTGGILLRLPQVAMATAQVLFQRFYYSKSFVRQNFEVTGMGCLLLASKIEETPRRVRDIINVFHHIKQFNNQKSLTPMILDQSYLSLKYQVIKAERRVLKELGFCVHVQHPHKLIVLYLQVLGLENKQNLMQLSWNYMNDSLRTDVFVRYQPETVACACIYLTARKLKLPLPRSPPWFAAFNVNEEDLQDICLKILRLYARPKPKAEELEKKVQELCKKFEETRLRNKIGFNNITSGNNTPNSPSNIEKRSPKRSRSNSRTTSNSPRHKRYKRSRSRSHEKYKKSRSRRSRSMSPYRIREKRNRSRSRSYERVYHKEGKYVADSYKEEKVYSREERYRKDEDRYRREDEKFKRDDDYRYKREDDKYKKEEEDYKYKRDEDRRKDDEKYRKDDERKEKVREDGKVNRKDEEITRDGENDRRDRDEKYERAKEVEKRKEDGHKHKRDKVKDEESKRTKSKHSSSKHKNASEKKKRKKHYDEAFEDDEIEIIAVKKDKKSR